MQILARVLEVKIVVTSEEGLRLARARGTSRMLVLFYFLMWV